MLRTTKSKEALEQFLMVNRKEKDELTQTKNSLTKTRDDIDDLIDMVNELER